MSNDLPGAAAPVAEETQILPLVEERETSGGTRYSLRVFSPAAAEAFLQGDYRTRGEAEANLKEFAVPVPGDAVKLTGSYIGCKTGDIAIINGTLGKVEPNFLITFYANDAFRDDRLVQCSGGPSVFVPRGNLVYSGETYNGFFWRWKDKPRADGGERYRRRVNLWLWDGDKGCMTSEFLFGGFRHKLQVGVGDLEELMARCGPDVLRRITGLTEEARAEIERLEALPFVESRFVQADAQGALLWWEKRLVSKERALTPDI